MFLLRVILFPENIQSFQNIQLFSDSTIKKIEMTLAAVNYMRQYQLNFS